MSIGFATCNTSTNGWMEKHSSLLWSMSCVWIQNKIKAKCCEGNVDVNVTMDTVAYFVSKISSCCFLEVNKCLQLCICLLLVLSKKASHQHTADIDTLTMLLHVSNVHNQQEFAVGIAGSVDASVLKVIVSVFQHDSAQLPSLRCTSMLLRCYATNQPTRTAQLKSFDYFCIQECQSSSFRQNSAFFFFYFPLF